MSVSIPDLAGTRPAPVLRVANPTLAATVPTAMLLVDYTLAGKTIPSPELQALAMRLPTDLVRASGPVRASMAHGAVLRTVLLNHLPPNHPGHTDWAALREWMAALSDEAIHWLIDTGVGALMQYGKPPRTPPSTAPPIEPLAKASTAVRRHAVEVLQAWNLPDAKERAGELLDAATFRSVLLQLLDAIWNGWLQKAWSDGIEPMRAIVAGTPTPPPGCSGAQWISLVTGIRPDQQYTAAADNASELVLVPSPGLGRSLSLFTTQPTWVLFTPHIKPSGAAERTGISVGQLGSLAPVMHALGDRTRLALVLHLLDQGPLTMQQLADALQVHQSTISRHVTTLRQAGVVSVGSDRHVTVETAAIRRACETLLSATENGAR